MDGSQRFVTLTVLAAFALGFLLRDELLTGAPATAHTTGPTQIAFQAPGVTGSDTFDCRWTATSSPYSVKISVRGGKAFRDDGGTTYSVVQNSDDRVVLFVDRQMTDQFAFQTIDKRSGHWTDFMLNGQQVRRFAGGRCVLRSLRTAAGNG